MYFEFDLDEVLQIEEPQGFSDIVLLMKRDDNWHGIFFEASTSDLTFFGEAAEYLREKKRTQGLRSEVTFRARQACGVYDELETIFEGKLDFRKFTETCGTICGVTMPVEQTGCIMTLRNRYDQKVDMDSAVAFNKTTAIERYAGLNFEMEIAAKELEAAVDGSVANEGDIISFDVTTPATEVNTLIRPTYGNERSNSILTGQLIPVSSWETDGFAAEDSAISPQLLYEDNIECFDGNFEYSIRMKGNLSITGGSGTLDNLNLLLITWDGVGNIFDDHTVISSTSLATSVSFPIDQDFDSTISGVITLSEGIGLYALIETRTRTPLGANRNYVVTFDKETLFTLSAPKLCPATRSNVYLVNEALSHAIEAVTDGCMKVKSDYYGRTDSEPYASDEDGCGSLRVLTSGLKIRRAENAAFFASPKDLFDGLKPIDNIGMGIEDNEEQPGAQWVRIEPVEYFYRNEEILSCPAVPEARVILQEQQHYSVIKTGYKKWEVENINGLNEFNSNREYRTSLNSVNNTLDITSAFIAGGYPWEITRQQSFSETGKADTKFDNDTFIACVERDAYGYHIEQDNIEDAENIFSPETAYNWRIRPLSNLMRWFKSIANSYTNLVDTTNKLFFSSGTGNYLASGELAGSYAECKLENTQKAENRDLYRSDFANPTEATPLWKPEYLTFKYPLSAKGYKAIKSNPYGYVNAQCGNGNYVKGFIQEIRYSLNKGSADFVLKLKWE